MLNIEQLKEINKLKCSEHNKKTNAKCVGEDINFDICCENFTAEIKQFVRDKALINLQQKTRKALGLN